MTGLHRHFADIIWVVLFPLLYLIHVPASQLVLTVKVLFGFRYHHKRDGRSFLPIQVHAHKARAGRVEHIAPKRTYILGCGALPPLTLTAYLALGGLAFAIGLVFVIMGRSELFTENFLIPVVAVLNRKRTLRSLLEVFAFSWLGNMVGCATAAVLFSIPQSIGEPIHTGYAAYSAYKLGLPTLGLFTSAVLAGLVMTALTWVLLAVRSTVGEIMAIFAGGYVLFGANLSHSIIGASLLFVGFSDMHKSIIDVLAWIGIATAGNLVGGVGLVTLFRMIQTKEKAKASQSERN